MFAPHNELIYLLLGIVGRVSKKTRKHSTSDAIATFNYHTILVSMHKLLV